MEESGGGGRTVRSGRFVGSPDIGGVGGGGSGADK